jgi:ABC-type protease/lipase transport system fused ATPase/permease subunit
LQGLKQSGHTVIVITHRTEVLSIVDKLLVMSLGQVLVFGDRASVLARVRGTRVAAVDNDAAGQGARVG